MTRRATIEITPFDTLMFRDGRPFNQNDPGAATAVSVFPPFSPTIVGAIRMGLWTLLGNDTFPTHLLGDGTDWQAENILGPLNFGPLRLHFKDKDYLPAPLHLLHRSGGTDKIGTIDTLRIGGAALETDLGPVVLPEMPKTKQDEPRPEQLDDHWISVDGLADLQKGKMPRSDTILCSKALFVIENRVGIGVDPKTGVAADHQLYMASHIRLKDKVTLRIDVAGLPDKFAKEISFFTAFGGEGRSAQFDEVTDQKFILPHVAMGDTIALALFSPADLTNITISPGAEIIPGFKLITVCAGKPVVAGGWDSQGKRPIPLRQLVPAGSVFFLSSTGSKGPENLPQAIGRATEWGFGHCCILPWPKGAN